MRGQFLDERESPIAMASLLRGGGQHPGHQQNESQSQRQEFRVNQREHTRYLLWITTRARTLR